MAVLTAVNDQSDYVSFHQGISKSIYY